MELQGLTKGIFHLDAEPTYPGGYDVIILTVKAYQTRDAVNSIRAEYGDEILITFQNGVGIVDMLREFDVLPGSTSIGAHLISPGIVKHAGMGDTFIGELGGEITERVRRIAENFTSCGLKTEAVDNIMERRWIKAAVNACINPLTAVLNVPNGALMDENIDPVVRCIAEECEEVLRSRGIGVDIYQEARKVIENTSENISSMLQDLRRGRRTEVDYILKPFTGGKCVSLLHSMVKFLEGKKSNW